MKSISGALIMAFFFCTSSAQVITANDSISTGENYTQMVFYNLSTGVKTITPDTDWHIAVTVRPTQFPSAPLGGTTIRFNEADGMRVYIAPNADASSFNTLDTTGWHGWHRLHDSDSAIDMGAFNSNRNPTNIFDFGWGKYNPIVHDVDGDSVYLIQLPDGKLKKFFVIALVYDTAIDLQYANIDNSDFQTIHIDKGNYIGKEFVYLNLNDNVIHDKEPLSTDWDLEALHYATDFPKNDTTISKTGLWINKGVSVAKATGVDVNANNYFNYNFTDSLDAIGWDWQLYDSAAQTYYVKDSQAYFVQNHFGQVYKIIFTGFGGNLTGMINFYSMQASNTTSINETKDAATLNLYPNPANNLLNIYTGATSSARIKIFDITGSLLSENLLTTNTTQVNTSLLPDGIYLISISASAGPDVYKKFVVNH